MTYYHPPEGRHITMQPCFLSAIAGSRMPDSGALCLMRYVPLLGEVTVPVEPLSDCPECVSRAISLGIKPYTERQVTWDHSQIAGEQT